MITKLPEMLLMELPVFENGLRNGVQYEEIPTRMQRMYLAGIICFVGVPKHGKVAVADGSYVLYYRMEDALKKWYKFCQEDVFEF